MTPCFFFFPRPCVTSKANSRSFKPAAILLKGRGTTAIELRMRITETRLNKKLLTSEMSYRDSYRDRDYRDSRDSRDYRDSRGDRDSHRDRDRGGGDGPGYGRKPPNVEGMVSLKVDNLAFRVTPDDLMPLFEKYGEVGDIYIPRDPYSKESRGFAFVRFLDRRDADDAMYRMDGYNMEGREMRVQLARFGRPNENRRRGGGGRG